LAEWSFLSYARAIVEFAAGDEIGRFRIEGVVGRGGMAVVYRAREAGLDRQVALKVISPQLAADDDFRLRFVREARLAASLEHPNIVPLYSADEVGGELFIAMRLVDGMDLATHLQEHGRLSFGDALDILQPIADALDTAHQRGLIHRDVKPANILVGRPIGGHASVIYLTDFGVVHETGAGLSQPGSIIGTVDYMSPEQIDGPGVDGRADQYSLACTLFEMLTGAAPFAPRVSVQAMYAHVNEQPPALSSRRADTPARLDAVVARALAKKASDRFPTCEAFIAAARAPLAATREGPRAAATILDAPREPLNRSIDVTAADPRRAREPLTIHDEQPATAPARGHVGSGPPPAPPLAGGPAAALPETRVRAGRGEPVARAGRRTRATAGRGAGALVAAGILACIGAAACLALGLTLFDPGTKTARAPTVVVQRPAAARSVRVTPATIQVPASFEPSAATAGLGGGTSRLFRAAAGGGLLLMVQGISGSNLLPANLVAGKGARAVVAIGPPTVPIRAYRYTGLHYGAAPAVAYAVPTDRGVVVVVCFGEGARGIDACRGLLRTLRISGAHVYAPGDPASITRMQNVLAHLAQSIRTRSDALAAAHAPATQAQASRSLASAYAAAADGIALDKVSPELRFRARHLRAALLQVHEALNMLAKASTEHDKRAYAHATRAIARAQRDVAGTGLSLGATQESA
jgi:protein kinase-like protein